MKAPNFNLADQNGQNHNLAEYAGKWLVLYFYPRDDTPGCTREACIFRDSSSEFEKAGVEIVGISKDTAKSHAKFANKFKLNFTILADPEHEVIDKYGSWKEKSMFGRKYMGTNRDTYLINPQGEIVKKYTGVNPLTHSKEVLKDLETLQQ